ncbi:MAG: aldehyde dehydrogenase family protein [Peptococcaceae bacterium]|jgi:succinate-semialdehyde dehydrogenase/glutarate-semialdehyde dehydrogenase|nr:aldehyde dehydrogenase family protein [Peptococcaceae bacterium]
MTTFEQRLAVIGKLAAGITEHRTELVRATVEDIGFPAWEAEREIDLTVERLSLFSRLRPLLAGRVSLARGDEYVAIALPYDGNTWMNTAIVSVWLAGNPVRVKFAGKNGTIAGITEEMYAPLFGGEVSFDRRSGRNYLESVLADPKARAVIVFGSDRHVLPYYRAVRQSGKKFIFEGPGNDPFIILEHADLEAAVADLMESKYRYSGQTCVAPERILVHESIYAPFLECFIEKSRRLIVGQPGYGKVDVVPLASASAARNIGLFLEDARAKGGRMVLGGQVRGTLVEPAIVAEASEFMWGMRDELFGPVSFVAAFADQTEAVRLAQANRYGLRASVFGDPKEAEAVATALRGADYCREVPEYVFGRFGTVSVNESRSVAWREALITKPIGGYGYSGWIWETVGDRFVLKQGPRLFSLETSVPVE